MASPSKRLLFLEKTTGDGSKDPFTWYALAMEYRSLERPEDALRVFSDMRSRFPDYVAMYLMCGQVLRALGRTDDARDWLEEGHARAKAKGDSHTASEIEAALGTLE